MIIYFKVAWLKSQVRNINLDIIRLNNHKYYYKLVMNNQLCLLIVIQAKLHGPNLLYGRSIFLFTIYINDQI